MLPLVCIDVDGTLVGSAGTPTAAVWAAADAAVARGQHLALCTARGAFGPTWEHARRLDPDGWHVFHAGAAIVHTGSGAVRAEPLDPAVVAACAAVAEARGWVFELYAPADYTVASAHPLAVAHAGLLGVAHRVRTPDTLDGPVVRVQFVVPRAEAAAVVAAAPPATNVTVATSPVMPEGAFVTVTPAGVDKATAIACVAAELGVDLADVMMVGDGANDLAAIRAVGHGTAMGNAEPEVLAAARHHVGHVDDDGLVDALELSARL